MALVAKARQYDKSPSVQETKESLRALQDFSHKRKLDDKSFYDLCKAIFYVSHEREVEVDGIAYFWSLKKGLFVTEVNDMRLWI